MELEDKRLKQLMQDSRLEMPFSDFEDDMMAKIVQYESKKRKASQSHFYATLFFLLGTVFGMVLNFMLSQKLYLLSSSAIVQERFYLISQIAYVVLIVIFSDKLWKLIKLKENVKF